MKFLYIKYTRERLPKYQLETAMYELEDGSKGVRKRMLTSQGESHIRSIYEQTIALSHKYKEVDILVPVLRNNELHYPFVEGETWDTQLYKLFLERNYTGFINKLKEFINKLNNVQLNQKEEFQADDKFKKVFGIELILKDTVCLQPANIDMIFDNIMDDVTGRTVLFDCEWVFNFKVPVDYIIWRSIYAFWIKRQNDLGAVFSFDQLCSIAGLDIKLHPVFHVMEETYFQRFVHGSQGNNYLDQYLKPKYLLENVVKRIESDRFNSSVYLPVNKVYTYVETNTEPLGQQSYELVFNFSEPFEDHIRIDPVNLPAEVEFVRIQVKNENDELIVECCKKNEFDGLTYSDDVVQLYHEQNFHVLVTENSHFFLKIDSSKVSGKSQVIVKMHVNTNYSRNILNYFNGTSLRLKELDQEYFTLNESYKELNQNTQYLETKNNELYLKNENLTENINRLETEKAMLLERINDLDKQSKDLENVIGRVKEQLSEKDDLIKQMQSTRLWRTAEGFRNALRKIKGKR